MVKRASQRRVADSRLTRVVASGGLGRSYTDHSRMFERWTVLPNETSNMRRKWVTHGVKTFQIKCISTLARWTLRRGSRLNLNSSVSFHRNFFPSLPFSLSREKFSMTINLPQIGKKFKTFAFLCPASEYSFIFFYYF